MQNDFTGINWYNREVKQLNPLMAYTAGSDFHQYQQNVREKLQQLLGDMPKTTPVDITIVAEEKRPRYRLVSLILKTSDDNIPCHLVMPNGATPQNPAPVMVCMQGHETGMNVSLGEPVNQRDKELLGDHMDFALQAIDYGFATLLVEMRFMGERRFTTQPGQDVISCYRPTMAALLMGKTTLGLRVADLRSAITGLEQLSQQYPITIEQLICLGHSGAGTATYFTACLDERIKGIVISCALCNFEYSILHTEHCSCNYVPGLAKYFKMSDMAAGIYPRPIISLGGISDDIFLIEGVEKTLAEINTMYTQQGAPGQCVLCKGDGGHAFYPEQAWPQINKMYTRLLGGESS